MTLAVWPVQVKHLGPAKVRKARRWLLDIAGPFCPMHGGPQYRYSFASDIANRVSEELALATTFRVNRLTLSIRVVVTEQDKARLRAEVYEADQKRK